MASALIGLTLSLLAACAASDTAAPDRPGGPQPAATSIDKIELLTPPTPVNIDRDRPGPDGFAASIYAVREQPFGLVPIESGTLEILLFDGALTRSAIDGAEPRQTWSFTADELRPARQRTAVGVGYGFTIPWDRDEPFEHDDVTVIVRYNPPAKNAGPIYSEPVILSLRAR